LRSTFFLEKMDHNPKKVSICEHLEEGLECDVIEQHGREYLLAPDSRLFTSTGKFIGWLINGVYEPSSKILKKREQERERIDQEARARLFYERERQKKERFEEAVKRRMDELRRK